MKLINFKATNVNGYLSFDINFYEDITYLIGLNGCGKTTVLKLISGLLLPSYDYLATIMYDSIEITLKDNDQNYYISSRKDKQKITITLNDEKPSSFQLISCEDYQISKNEGFITPQLSNIYRAFDKSELIQKIRQLSDPIILGLNRRIPSKRINIDREDYINRRAGYNIRRNNFSELDIALFDIRDLMFSQVRQNAAQQKIITANFREALIKETMRLSDFNSIEKVFSGKINFAEEKKKLEKKEEDITLVINNLGISELKDSINTYFREEKELLLSLDVAMNDKSVDEKTRIETVSPLMMKWVLNGSQLEKIDKINELGNKYNAEIDRLNSNMVRLKNSLNIFFEETGKKIDITGDGNIDVILPNGDKNSIFNLSSGEKQLIILFGHVIFSSDINGIFIIDEPELSLHLSWQEKFVKALLKANPSTQFILATHAPAIINETNSLNKCINLSKK